MTSVIFFGSTYALSVSEKIKLAIQERESWDEKRRNARKLAEQYSWDSLAQKSHEKFIELLYK